MSRHQPTPVVELNAAVALARSAGPAQGLRLLDDLDRRGVLAGFHLLPAARADLLARLGRPAESRAAWEQALALAQSPSERRFIEARLGELATPLRRRRRGPPREAPRWTPLGDDAWRRVAPMFPPRKGGPGRPPREVREILDAVLYVLATASPWRALPAPLGPWQTAYHHFRAWENDGTLERALETLSPRSGSARLAAQSRP